MFVNLHMYDVCIENVIVYRLSCTLHRTQILYCTQRTLYIKMYNILMFGANMVSLCLLIIFCEHTIDLL